MTAGAGAARRLVLSAGAAVALVAWSCVPGDRLDPPAASPGATPGGRIVVGVSEPTSIDPSSAADPSSALVVRTMCDPLVQIDPGTGRLVGAIAESWQVTDGGKRFTVKLRKGVRFHDGSELTADDVVFSLSRVASEEVASPLAPVLRPLDGYRQVHGEEVVDEPRLRETLRGLRVIEQYSFEMNLTEPHADMINLLGHPLASPVPKKVVERDPAAFAARPVCAGPYQLGAPWGPGQPTITLRRFAGYKPVNEGYTAAGRGYVDEIELRIVPGQEAELAQFVAGQLDVAHVPRGRVPELRRRGDDLVLAPGPRLQYIGLPNSIAPFNRPEVRTALSQALDRRAIGERSEGPTVPARGFLSPTVGPSYRETGCGPAAPDSPTIGGAEPAISAAKTELAGRKVKVYFNDEFGHRPLMETVAAQWKRALGLDVELVPQPWEAHLALATSPTGFDGPFLMSWAPPYSSPDAYLAPLFESSRIPADNFSHFADASFDRLLQRVARESGEERDRGPDYQQLEDLACQQMPVLPLNFDLVAHLVRRQRLDSARGTSTDLSTGDVLLRELYVKAAR